MNGEIFGYEGFVEVNVQIPGRDFSECHGLKIRVFYFFYIFQTLQMNRISFMASLLNAVL